MNAEFIEALRQIEREKDIPFDTLWQALEAAMSTAYKKTLGVDQDVTLRIEHSSGKQPIYFRKMTVVETVANPHAEITVEEARRVFVALSDRGTVQMELGPTFWSEAFGMVTDRFGVTWMINKIPSNS